MLRTVILISALLLAVDLLACIATPAERQVRALDVSQLTLDLDDAVAGAAFADDDVAPGSLHLTLAPQGSALLSLPEEGSLRYVVSGAEEVDVWQCLAWADGVVAAGGADTSPLMFDADGDTVRVSARDSVVDVRIDDIEAGGDCER